MSSNPPSSERTAASSSFVSKGGALEEKLKGLFDGMADGERQQSLQRAINILQTMLRSVSSIPKNFASDPEDEITHDCSPPFLVPLPDGTGFALPFIVPLASQRVYDNRWTILPSRVANIPCHHMTPSSLLRWMNIIFATRFRSTVAVEACLAEFIDDGCDLGQVYGYLRPWWLGIRDEEEFKMIPAAMQDRREKDYNMRAAAITGNRITNSRIPPRRVWDLYANRVLPYHAMKPSGHAWEGEELLPVRLWAVSHSWRAPSERQLVLTTINGRAWRVPIPYGTTLNDIRDELLILGAEYVFLDVLCLRQKDEHLPEFETIRKREWRLDVPTIGHIYNEDPFRPVIVYFNGLGLPFDGRPPNPSDQFNWFNRVWTLQETPINAIIGGLEHKPGPIDIHAPTNWPAEIGVGFLDSFKTSIEAFRGIDAALRTISLRFHSNPVDQVACLAYLILCPTLPIYDADMDVEAAWSSLVECLPDKARTELLFSNFGPLRHLGTWRPTWDQVRTCTRFKYFESFVLHEHEKLKHLDGFSPNLGYKQGYDAYYHKAYVVEGCRIHIPRSPGDAGHCSFVEMPLAEGSGCASFRAHDLGKSIVPDNVYLLISVGTLEHWVVARIEGARRIGSETALEVLKVSTLTIMVSEKLRRMKHRVGGRQRLVVYR